MEPSDPTIEQNPPTQPLVADFQSTPVASPARQTVPRRRALLSDDDNAPAVAPTTDATRPGSAPAAAATSYIVKTNRPANQRRGKPILWLLGLIFIGNLLMLGAFGAWYYNTINDAIESRLGSLPSRPAQPQPTAAKGAPATSSVNSTDSAALQDKVADLQAQLQAMQKRLTDTEQSTKSLASRTQGSSAVPAAIPIPSPGTPAAAGSAPISDDLILLKERNRLTAYADEAISTASRAPYTQLWKAINDPRLVSLAHATRAEILRVQNYYLSGSRLDRFDIPVADYYPDSAALRDAQLSDEQLIRLLGNAEHPWQVRLKAANLLGLRRSTIVGDALVKAIKSDDNLDVVKEATFSFEQLTGYHAQLFESETLDAWWKQYNETPPTNTPAPADAPAPASAAEDKPSAKPEADSKSKEETKAKEKPPEATDSKAKTKPGSTPAKGKDKAKDKNQSTIKDPSLPELILPVEKP